MYIFNCIAQSFTYSFFLHQCNNQCSLLFEFFNAPENQIFFLIRTTIVNRIRLTLLINILLWFCSSDKLSKKLNKLELIIRRCLLFCYVFKLIKWNCAWTVISQSGILYLRLKTIKIISILFLYYNFTIYEISAQFIPYKTFKFNFLFEKINDG